MLAIIETQDEMRAKIMRMIQEEKIPATTILISVNELGQDVSIFRGEFDKLVEKVEQANADELRASVN
ncbi:hypothetical protein MGH68_08820 [Erysipelothrix sp. D19-032]